ncbi:MAG TPA: protein kinase [Pyrinomonadaceae bacterium]|nr:protein kinase [Pyrinomonadaceae bacterium]
MSDRNLAQVEEVFHVVVELPADQRAAYLEQLDDQALGAEVMSLISALESSNGLIDEPAFDLGLDVLSRTSAHSMVGKTVGSYRIISQLGKGGMGEVYLAEDMRLARKVALKFLSRELIGDEWAKRQLIKEAQAVAILDHPNICPVYGIEDFEELTFIVMQYVEGQTLSELIAKNAMPFDQIVPLARQIVGALAEAHAHGIIHRDIKPRNIMVTPSGQVKVLDFGLAKSVHPRMAVDSMEDSVSNLVGGLVPGTVAYMSPEQLRGEKLDFRSDIFSVGTVLYEIASGTNPYARENYAETISAILTHTAPPLAQSNSQKGLDAIIQRCLLKDREERFQSASALLVDLEHIEHQNRSDPLWSTYLTLRAGTLLAVFLLIIVASAVFYSRWTAKTHRIAVLPITCEGISTDCPGASIRDTIIARLSRRSDFKLITDDAQLSSIDSAADPQAIGSKLGVEAVLTGRIFKRGDSTILQTRLESASSTSRLTETEYVLPSPAVPLNEELSIRLAFYPDTPLTEDEKKTFALLAALQNRAPEAVEYYLRGSHFWNRRDRENIPKAIEFFEKAIDRDPVYAPAYSGLANCYLVMSSTAYGTLTPKDAMERANAAAKKALEIDPNLAEAHTSLGVVQMRYRWNWVEAEKEFKRAIELKPDYPLAHYWYSNLLGMKLRTAEALAESETAKSLDPLTPLFITNLGRAYYRARDYDKAIDYFTKVLEEKPDNTSAKYVLAYAYFQKGRYPEAVQLLEQISASNKWLAAGPLGYAYAKMGRRNDAWKILAEMDALPKSENLPAQERALIYLGLGDHDSTFVWLEKSYEDRFPSILALTSDPIFDSLKSDSRYAVLAQKINLTP